MAAGKRSKRKREEVDLTGDDEQPDRRQPNPGNGVSQAVRDSWVEPQASQFDASAEVEDSSQTFNDDAYNSLAHYGTLSSKVVGVRYYRGYATPGEFVTVLREPANQYDSNAIRVNNVNGEQIGHVPRGVAAKLAPFTDDGSIVVEGQLAGDIGDFDGPLSLNIFGTRDPLESANLRQRLKEAKLPINVIEKEIKDRQKRAKEMAKERERLRKEAAKARKKGEIPEGSDGHFANLSMPGDDPQEQDMDDIMASAIAFDPRELQNIANKSAANEETLSKLPKATQPELMATKMLPYQLQGLAWLLDRESPELPGKGSKDTVQLWKHNANDTCTNIATNFTQKSPTLAKGGILADDMGLGKTIQIIALLVADPSRNGLPTLILSPLSVMSNWSGQIATHIKKDKPLKVLHFHGQAREKMTAKDLTEYDVVITTYQTAASEHFSNKTSALFSTTWRRIVVDEGHNLRNPKAKMSVAACHLKADCRWILTGTPIVNNLKDLYAHIKFIRYTGGLEKQDVFNGALVRPLNQLRPEGKVLLQALMSSLCLRRMKDMKFVDLRLPTLSSHKYTVTFKPHEREKYDAFQQEAKGLLLDFQRKKKDGSTTYSHLLEVLLRMRQVCNHWELTGERLTHLLATINEEKTGGVSPENKKILEGLLQLAIDNQEDCAVCLDTLHNPVITTCAHAFGRECIERVIETQHKCPMCRTALRSVDQLVEPAAGGDHVTADLEHEKLGVSSKVEALMSILKASAKKKQTKTVIFSQWTSFLDVIGRHIKDAGFNFCRLDGTMRADQRDTAIQSIMTDPKCTIMLASLSVCSVGLNLTAANQVILADSWWAPAIEDQAIDRVYRLGQERPVQVFRLVMEDSIEERVLDIQADKRKLMMTAFGETTMKRGQEKMARLADIQRLLK